MDTVDKLKTINYVCETCKKSTWMGNVCRTQSGMFTMEEEARYEYCEYLRVRIRNIDKSLNNTLYADEIKPMSADDFSSQINPSGKSMSDDFSRVKPNETFYVEDIPAELSIEDAMKERVKAALEKEQGNRKSAANMLGVSERSVYRWIKQFGL